MMTTKNTNVSKKKIRNVDVNDTVEVKTTEWEWEEKKTKKRKISIKNLLWWYWIPTKAVEANDVDYEKYWVKEEDKEAIEKYCESVEQENPLTEWILTEMSKEERMLVAKYGIKPLSISKWEFDKLGVVKEDIEPLKELYNKQYKLK